MTRIDDAEKYVISLERQTEKISHPTVDFLQLL